MHNTFPIPELKESLRIYHGFSPGCQAFYCRVSSMNTPMRMILFNSRASKPMNEDMPRNVNTRGMFFSF